MAKHQHTPESGFLMMTCPKCGAGAMNQRRCSKCHRTFCEKCQVGAPPASAEAQREARRNNKELSNLF